MRAPITALFILLGLTASACGSADQDVDAIEFDVAPNEFVLLPCGTPMGAPPCALAIAGGKRILLGAPAGIVTHLRPEDLRQLDVVMLFSLRAADIEGLDEVRNRSWQAGRDTPLLVVGPTGVDDLVVALNKAYEQADALRIVEEGIPPGGFDAAVLIARSARSGQTVFDTGDVIVERLPSGFRISYEETARADLVACASGPEQTALAPEEKIVRIACDIEGADHVWPLVSPLPIAKNE
jgi:hypothetical protein